MKIIMLFFINLFLFISPLQAETIKCWTNEDGVTECGNFVPPEYSQQGYAERNEQGIITKEVGRAKTPAEIEALRQQEHQKKELEEQRKQQEADERALLMQFSTEEDIQTQKSARLSAIEGVINSIRSYVDSLERNLIDLEQGLTKGQETIEKSQKKQEELRGELASLSSSTEEEEKVHARQSQINTTLPILQRDINETNVQLEKVNKDIADIKYRIRTNQDTLNKKALEKETVEKQYTDYLNRFREVMKRRTQTEIDNPAME